MDLPENVINETEAKIRKRWLLATLSIFLIYPFVFFVVSFNLSYLINIPKETLVNVSLHVLRGIIPTWIIYHCAYKKYGTAMLCLWLVVVPLRWLFNRVELLIDFQNIFYFVFGVIETAFFIWWYLLSLKLCKINKKVQTEIFFPNRS